MASHAVEYLKMFPSTSSLLSLYASFSTSLMLLRNFYNEVVPEQVESFIAEKIKSFWSEKESPPSLVTLIVDDSWDDQFDHNELIDAARTYIATKIGDRNMLLKAGKFPDQKRVIIGLMEGEEVVDLFDGIEVTWLCTVASKEEDSHYRVKFENKHRRKIIEEYFPHVLNCYEELTHVEKSLKLLTRPGSSWKAVDLRHPATFDSLAMEFHLRKSMKEDLERFLARRDFYKRVGKAWKRGYLLYGPPGTGKSSLVAAIANFLNFDVYELDLSNIYDDSDLRNAWFAIENKSIVVIEDIDCYPEVRFRSKSDEKEDDKNKNTRSDRFSLSTLLNCMDGLWSCRGEERIIVFTTNRKEVLDPALVRPGRMDMHIYMGYCSFQGFKGLALNYLEIEEHKLFDEIEELIGITEVTPASIAEELMKSEDPDVALAGVVSFLKQKKIEKDNPPPPPPPDSDEEKGEVDDNDNDNNNNDDKEEKKKKKEEPKEESDDDGFSLFD